MKKLTLMVGLLAVTAGGTGLAEARGPDKVRPESAGDGSAKGKSRKCAKPRRVGFVVKGTFVSGDAVSVTLKVLRANRHAVKSGLVTVGDEFTATPSKASRIRYVNRSGPADAQPTDKVRVVGKVTKLKRGCSSDDFTPTVTVRKVMVIAPDPDPGESSDD